MLSVIIPAYQEPFLQKTIDSLLESARGNIEIIPVLDGYKPDKPLKKHPRVKPIVFEKNIGMRGAINAGIKKARGKFIMKCDAHCLFGEGFDKILTGSCQPDWLVIPRRYSLDEINWKRDERRPIRDYHYIHFPVQTRDYGLCLINQDWIERTKERRHDPKLEIDDTMTFQGSCWVADRKYFKKRVGLLDDSDGAYGPFGGEQIEIGLKYWLGGGQVKVVKKTWYAHLSKMPRHYRAAMFTRKYKVNRDSARRRMWTAKHWVNNEEPNMVHSFSWLVEKFWPVPTWPEDRKLWVLPK